MDDTRSTANDDWADANATAADGPAPTTGADEAAPGETTPGETTPGETGQTADWTTRSGAGTGSATAKEWVGQLQTMIENIAQQAAPAVREIGAKAAELAAVAGEKAGPVAHKAAEVTEQAGSRIAERSREFASELRRDREGASAGAEGSIDAWGGPATATETATATDTAVAAPDDDRSGEEDRPAV